MTTILNRIIMLNIELEGALRVAANRPSIEALENAKSKFAEISALFAMLNPTEFLASSEAEKTEVKIEEAENAESEPLSEPAIDLTPDAFETIVETYNETRVPSELRKMFTINDKFRFKRELFENNDEEFNATFDLISTMSSFSEVEEYAYEDLKWDRENACVKDFMSVIENFFG